MTQQQSQGNNADRDLAERGKRNARFDQEIADSRDHDKQSGKDGYQKKPEKPAAKKSRKS